MAIALPDRWRFGRRRSIATFARCCQVMNRAVSFKALHHPGEKRTCSRPGYAMQKGPVELTPELTKGRHVRSRQGDPASVRVERGELHVTIEHGKKPWQLARFPGEGYDEGVSTIVRRTKCHPHFAGCSSARPRRSDAEVQRLALLLSRAREGREPAAVTHETSPHLLEGTRDISKIIKEKPHCSTPVVLGCRVRIVLAPR